MPQLGLLSKILPILILMSILTLIGSNVFAQSKICTGYKHVSFVSISLSEGDTREDWVRYNCMDFRPLDQLVGEIKQISPVALDRPSFVAVPPPFDGVGAFNPKHLNILFGFSPKDTQEALDIQKVLAHEIGHQIFETYIQDSIPILTELKSLRERKRAYTRAFLLVLKFQSPNPVCVKSDCANTIQEIINTTPSGVWTSSDIIKEFADKNLSELERITHIVSPYHELFADVVRSVYFEDTNKNQISSFGWSHKACRSFEEILPDNFRSEDPHCALSAIRVDLWNKWIIPRIKNKKQLLGELADAFLQEFIDQALDPSVPEKTSAESLQSLRKRLGL
jgi:hypothetical protein